MGLYKKAAAMGRRAAQAIKKRYTAKPGGRKSTGGVRVAKMAKDIMYLKSVLNPEKKRKETQKSGPTITLGQVNGNSDGAYYEDITPIITQGIGSDQRNGAGLKLHSSMWHFQFVQMPAASGRIRGVIEIWEVNGDPYPAASTEWFDEHYQLNPFSGVRDLNCMTNPDHFMKGKCIARRNFSVAADQVTGEKMVTDLKIPIKYNKGQGKHIRYQKETDTVANGQMYLLIRLDRGNRSTAVVSTLSGVPDPAVNTGIYMNYNKMDYFYDN